MTFKPNSPKLENASSDKNPPTHRDVSESAESEEQATGATGTDATGVAKDIDSDSLSIDLAMKADQFRLRKQKRQLPKEQFQQRLQASVALRQRRLAAKPRLEYPDELPISSHRDELIGLIRQHQVIIVCGETGSGKSTQLPKFCLEAGLGRAAMIGHTQPRRLAARSIAARLADEMKTSVGQNVGQWVGYQVRFGNQTGPETLVKLMTDGILLAETQSDRFLNAYDAIIIDEAHERSLNIDFLLGYLKTVLLKRPDFKLIITSATIDADRFAEHFCDDGETPAPIVNVSGRGYPVEIRYLPWHDVVDDDERGYDLARHVIAGLENLSRSGGDGDTLVFLPTERDIREVSHRVAGHYKRLGLSGRIDVLPLYARLPQKEQQLIFQPSGQRRRIIFATNVAESSLTVPGIRYVIDSGTARISRYSPRSKLQRLPIEPVSQASANQRAGRCGRVAPGICVRLYDLADFESRDAFTTPEIRRTNLASVVLQTKSLRLGPLETFPLLDPPRPESIREGVATLMELGALDEKQALTDVGRTLGRMPVDPRIGRILLAAEELGVLPEVLPIAAAMEIPDPRQRPPDKQQAADQAHAEFADPTSDFLSYLRLWQFYENARAEHSRNRLRRVLQKRFLSDTRMREWSDIYRQLKEMMRTPVGGAGPKKRHGNRRKNPIGQVRLNEKNKGGYLEKDRYAAVHQALLTGLLSGVAMVSEKNEYTGPRNLKLFLWPGSGVFESKPKWIVAAELVETAKQYARTVAKIEPSWIESVGKHLLKASYNDPHWSKKSGGAFCYQRLSLFGLPIVVRRRVPLPPIDPATARELMIEQGLVEKLLPTRARCVTHNRKLRESISILAAKTRRRDLVVDDYQVQRFYLERIPEEVCDRARLEKFDRNVPVPTWTSQLADSASVSAWLQSPPATEDASTPFMRPEDILDVTTDAISGEDYPDTLEIGSSELPLNYHFEPGGEEDGVHLKIHRAALSQVSDERLGWLVPGLLKPKLVSMIKSLPKRIRRNLVPAAEVAQQIYDELRPVHGQVPFLPAVCQAMTRHAEMPVSPSDFQAEKLEPHLNFLIDVVDDSGNTIAKGRHVGPLSHELGEKTDEPQAAEHGGEASSIATEPMTGFDIDSLPAEVIRDRGGVRVAQFPALVDNGDSVVARLFPDQSSADSAMAQGLTRLFATAERKELRRQVRWLPELDQAKIQLSGAIRVERFENSLMDLLARIAFVETQPLVRSRDAFDLRRKDRGEKISIAVQEVATWLTTLGKNHLRMRAALESTPGSRFSSAVDDVKGQLKWLLHDSFLSVTPWSWLKHYPRYLDAIAYRVEKLSSGSSARDEEGRQTVEALWRRWLDSPGEGERTPASSATSEFRWMIEELRVSLFAQPLGTSVKVSPKRCEKLL